MKLPIIFKKYMSKYFFASIIFFVIVGVGCAPAKNTQTINEQTNNSQIKVIDWCDEEKFAGNELRISSEYFNGMYHAPTIRHVCRGNKELFYLEMVWNDSATVHTGTLKSKKTEASLPISSENKDPEFELLQIQDKDKVQFTIDKKIFIYDEDNDKFIENPTTTAPSADERLALCNAAPIPREIGDNQYPIAKKYEKLTRLGQIFTAEPCDEARLTAVFKEVYRGYGEGAVQGSSLNLSKNPSSTLITIFKSIGYSCLENVAENQCKKWKLEKSVDVKALLQLEPYTEFFASDDCINCG